MPQRKRRNYLSKTRGFKYFRTKAQILDYMKIPAERKLLWLEEMWKFNRTIALHNPIIAKVQKYFR